MNWHQDKLDFPYRLAGHEPGDYVGSPEHTKDAIYAAYGTPFHPGETWWDEIDWVPATFQIDGYVR